MLKILAIAALLASSAGAFAQSAPAEAGKKEGERRVQRHHGRDCSQAADPKACEERREKARAAAKKARAACEERPAGERRACMAKEMCAQTADPAKCEARHKERMEKRAEQRKPREPE